MVIRILVQLSSVWSKLSSLCFHNSLKYVLVGAATESQFIESAPPRLDCLIADETPLAPSEKRGRLSVSWSDWTLCVCGRLHWKQQSGVDTAALKYTGWHILGHRDDFRKTCWVQASWKTVVLLHKLPALYWYKAAKLPVQQQHLKLISLEFKIDTTWALHMWTERPAPSYKPTSLTQRTRWLLYWRWTWALDINCEMQNPPIWM